MRDQWYWNKEAFETLARVADDLRDDPRLAHLARYCETRARGLRRPALRELEAFLSESMKWDDGSSRSITIRILDIYWREPGTHWFMTTPLRDRFIMPTLDRWTEEEPSNPLPLRHLALLRHNVDLLHRALSMNPADDQVRYTLAAIYIDHVDYAMHHLLADGVFIVTEDIANEADAHRELDRAEELIRSAPDPTRFAKLLAELHSSRRLLDDWQSYRQAPEGTFYDWCRARGREYSRPIIAYYDG